MEIILKSKDFVVFTDRNTFIIQNNKTGKRNYYANPDYLCDYVISLIGVIEYENVWEIYDAIETYKLKILKNQ